MKHNLINFCENDKNAVKSYCAIHNETESKNLGDITKVDIELLPKCDMITHGSPCQDFSIAGLQKGADEGAETRSSLIWNSIKIIQHCEPKFVIWENVKNVLSSKHVHNFEKYLSAMEELGYSNYYKVLNAKDYGIPQNRERIFCISIRKDIDCGFEFSEKITLDKELSDLYDSNVNKKYYLSEKRINYIRNRPKNFECKFNAKISNCLRTNYGNASANECYVVDNKGTRKFTPYECWAIQGFDKKDCHTAEGIGVKPTQLYKQAGNSIVVNVIVEIYKQLQKYYPDDFKDVSLISLFSGIGAFEKAFERV